MKKPARKLNPAEEVKLSPIPMAERILNEAIKVINTRADEHGDTEAQLTMVAEMWAAYIRHVMVIRSHIQLDASDVAQMMVLLKITRATYGTGEDHYRDAAGYSAIAAAVRGEYPVEDNTDDR